MTVGRSLFIVAICLSFVGLIVPWKPIFWLSGVLLAVSFAIDVFVY